MHRLPRLILAGLILSGAVAGAAQTLEKMEHSDALVGLRNLTVPPIARSETTNLIDGGVIETDGYSHMTLNLAAELKGPAPQKGVIGVLLIPDVEPFDAFTGSWGSCPRRSTSRSPPRRRAART
jgi:hypothetical protein